MNVGSHHCRSTYESFEAERTFIDIELFAGAGGMTLGLVNAGFSPDLLFEINADCCATLRMNTEGKKPWIAGNVIEDDVARVAWDALDRPVRLLSAGPPCQPFSLAGKHLADQDDRNEFPSTIRAIRSLRPGCVLIENVYGLSRMSFRPYLEYIVRQIECPDVVPKDRETWDHHDRRIRRRMTDPDYRSEYHAQWKLLNAADFGVPQARARVIILATRKDLPEVAMPAPTHSMASMIRDQISGEYWNKHGLRIRSGREFPKAPPGVIEDPKCDRLPWNTIRDGLMGLPKPEKHDDDSGFCHWLIPGARLYRGHTGSDLDWPSKTIKAGVHGVAGGENVIRLTASTHRYLTLREMARIQGFHDDYLFYGTRSRIISQIGNAVPCGLAEALGRALAPALQAFESQQLRTTQRVNAPLAGR